MLESAHPGVAFGDANAEKRPIEVVEDLFRFSGRMNRGLFGGILAGTLVVILTASAINEVLGVITLLAGLWVSAATAVKRAHDFDESGAWVLLTIIPVIGIVFGLLLWAEPGTAGPNHYGSDPLGWRPASLASRG